MKCILVVHCGDQRVIFNLKSPEMSRLHLNTYGMVPKAIRISSILSCNARPSLDVRFWRLKTVPALKGGWVVLKGLVIQVKVCDNSIGHGWVVTGTTLVIQISCLHGMFERFVLKFVQESPAIWRSISLTDLAQCGRQPERITSSENTWPSTNVSLTLSVQRSSGSDDCRRQILTSKVDSRTERINYL